MSNIFFQVGMEKIGGLLPPPWLRAWEKDLWKHEELVSVNLSEFTLATVRPETWGEKPPLEKNFDIVWKYWTQFKYFGPLSEKSSPLLMSQASYRPGCSSLLCSAALCTRLRNILRNYSFNSTHMSGNLV